MELNIVNVPNDDRATRSKPKRYSRWRAGTLIAVYLLMGLHIAHWKLNGSTLAPLELNEVMYTFELGIITAGFIFMAAAVASVLIFGRFFCSWGCHILALEDLCAWLLGKIGIRPKPVRSRVLLLVPFVAMFYMFIWPQFTRMLAGQPLPEWRVLGDTENWASLITDDFWRNLPGPWIAGLTFLICGFVIVYILGTRSFCKYACPYGAVFAFADRVAPGKIIAKGNCSDCGHCTAACTSNIRVHEELQAFGKVVSPSCLKDLDCVAACPEAKVGYGFTTPALFKSWSRSAPKKPGYDFCFHEDLLMAGVFIATILVFRGLYNAVPFLLSLGLAAILAYIAVICVRLVRSADVRLNNFQLKRSGQLSTSGRLFAATSTLIWLGFAHSAFIRYHEFRGHRTYAQAIQLLNRNDDEAASAAFSQSSEHLHRAHAFGLFHPTPLTTRLAASYLMSNRHEQAMPYVEQLRERSPVEAHKLIAGYHASQRRYRKAVESYLAALHAGSTDPSVRMDLAQCYVSMGQRDRAIRQYKAVIEANPRLARAHHNAGVLLAQAGRYDEAIAHAERAADLLPNDASVWNNLGFLQARLGRINEAEHTLRQVIAMSPAHADAHFNLARVLTSKSRLQEAHEHLQRAAQLDPKYAAILRQLNQPSSH